MLELAGSRAELVCVRPQNVLNEQGVSYSMPAFRGNGGIGNGAGMQPPAEPVQRAVSRAASQSVRPW